MFTLILKCDDDKTDEYIDHEKCDDDDVGEEEYCYDLAIVVDTAVVNFVGIDGNIQ